MFSYDSKNRILKVQKIPEAEMNLNLLEYQLESYNKYVTKTIYEDMEYLVQAMRDRLQVSQVEAKFKVGKLYKAGYKREVKKMSPSYYPVYARFLIDGVPYPAPTGTDKEPMIEIFRIPFMGADGILNVDGARRIIMMQMVAAERVSYGVDLRAPEGTPIGAWFSGTVIEAGYSYGSGNYIWLDHGSGVKTFYCHLSRIDVEKGQRVTQGTQIALSGNTGRYTTGPHLHMGLYVDGTAVDPRVILE